MTSLTGLHDEIYLAAFLFFFEQIALLIFIYKDNAGWKFRFQNVHGYGNLHPVAATWKVALFIFTLSLFIIPAIGFLYHDPLINYIKSLRYHILILISGLTGAFFFIWHYVVKKNWNLPQGILLGVSIMLFAVVFYINYNKFLGA